MGESSDSGCLVWVMFFMLLSVVIMVGRTGDRTRRIEDKLDKIEETLKLETKDGKAEKEADEGESGLDLQEGD